MVLVSNVEMISKAISDLAFAMGVEISGLDVGKTQYDRVYNVEISVPMIADNPQSTLRLVRAMLSNIQDSREVEFASINIVC